MNVLFQFPTDANFYGLEEAARKMRIPVAQLEEMVHAAEVDRDVVGWTCLKGHDGTWRLRLLGAFDFNGNAGEGTMNVDMRRFWQDTEATNRRRERWGKESL